MQTATVLPNAIPVRPSTREDDGSKWLVVSCPNGWDDVKKLTKKVLVYEGETYIWMSWNSDTNVANFKQSNTVATIKR